MQTYVEQAGKLLIDQPLRRASPGDNAGTIVRAQTLAVLVALGFDGKRILLQFLYESGLISPGNPLVSLDAANLRGVDLSGGDTEMIGADLREADLREAGAISNKDLEQQAYSLEGVTMPDGSKHP